MLLCAYVRICILSFHDWLWADAVTPPSLDATRRHVIIRSTSCIVLLTVANKIRPMRSVCGIVRLCAILRECMVIEVRSLFSSACSTRP